MPESPNCSWCNHSVHGQHNTRYHLRAVDPTSSCTSLCAHCCFPYDLVYQWSDVDNFAVKHAPRLSIPMVQGLGQAQTRLESGWYAGQ